MNKMNLILASLFSIVSFMSAASEAQAAPMPLLQLQDLNGQGFLLKEITVSDDGSVIKKSPNQDAVTIKNLSSDQIASIQKTIAITKVEELVQTHPDQTYNPGGSMSYYILFVGTNDVTFAENLSGVDFGLPHTPDTQLITLLQQLNQL
jgi:hypothetical protein